MELNGKFVESALSSKHSIMNKAVQRFGLSILNVQSNLSNKNAAWHSRSLFEYYARFCSSGDASDKPLLNRDAVDLGCGRYLEPRGKIPTV